MGRLLFCGMFCSESFLGSQLSGLAAAAFAICFLNDVGIFGQLGREYWDFNSGKWEIHDNEIDSW